LDRGSSTDFNAGKHLRLRSKVRNLANLQRAALIFINIIDNSVADNSRMEHKSILEYGCLKKFATSSYGNNRTKLFQIPIVKIMAWSL